MMVNKDTIPIPISENYVCYIKQTLSGSPKILVEVMEIEKIELTIL